MSSTWIRRPPEPRDSLTAGVVAIATAATVGVVAWYLTRTLLSREPLSLRPEDGDALESGDRRRIGPAPPGTSG